MNSVMRGFTRLAAAVLVAAIALLSGRAIAADGATKDQAVAMVQKAVAYIKAQGADKAYAEIDNPSGQFVDRDLYIAVYGLDGMVLVHAPAKARIDTNQIDDKDPDDKAFVRSGWSWPRHSRASSGPTNS